MVENCVDYVKMASAVFIEEYSKKMGDDVTGVLYNKYMTLLHRELKKEGIDIRLSHFWYRWGDAVVKYSVPYIHWTHEDAYTTKVSFIGRVPKCDPKDPVIQRSMEFARDFIREYGNGVVGVEAAIDEVYSEAPFEFQKEYRMLREGLKPSTSFLCGNFYEYVMKLFDNAMGAFPKEFKKLNKQKDWFVAVFTESVNNRVSRETLFDIIEDFWFFFCYHLRVNRRCYENVSKETLDIWKNAIPSEDVRFEHSIQNYAYQCCRSDSDNWIIGELLRERESRISKLEQLLDEMRD